MLNEILKPAFWDVDFDTLTWENHRDFIVRRILQSGTYEMIQWLRLKMSDDELRAWLKKRKGRGLSPRQLYYWKTMLNLSPAMVKRWVTTQGSVWNGRA